MGGATEGPRVCSLQGRPAGTAWRTWRTSAARATAAREESVQQWAEQGVGGSMRAQAQLQALRTTRRSARGWRSGQGIGGHGEQESGRTYGRRRGAPARGGPRPPPRLRHGAAGHGGDAQIARQLQGGQAPHKRWTTRGGARRTGRAAPLQVQVRSSGRPQNNAQTPGTADQHDVEGRSAGAGGGAAQAEQPRLDCAGGGARLVRRAHESTRGLLVRPLAHVLLRRSSSRRGCGVPPPPCTCLRRCAQERVPQRSPGRPRASPVEARSSGCPSRRSDTQRKQSATPPPRCVLPTRWPTESGSAHAQP